MAKKATAGPKLRHWIGSSPPTAGSFWLWPGGIVSEPETYSRLLAHFHTIWVKASPEEHMARVQAQGDTRPMADNPEAMDQLRMILSSREALYDRAEARLDTSGRDLDQSEAELATLIEDRGFLSA